MGFPMRGSDRVFSDDPAPENLLCLTRFSRSYLI